MFDIAKQVREREKSSQMCLILYVLVVLKNRNEERKSFQIMTLKALLLVGD
jgi:hypothetical protein